ncbi:class I SAM-dependent methyltransferase [Micromonospora sp. DR5-3]|uniref:class I SAM-dependent methyltransferase n=1 Tax=unclassified Micromonospora TaxID=2617518 RepID=UPI0011D3E554|nr:MULTISPECIES: class I SAM-dependent methyltransferase [unclassified Micromonospora]MCW3815641.1 class I SAM-dependent methyltransferase [Micromonospora sp. DR5-3]TYC23806.1 class I SAM-dependent methyltransferase [Micromonospora sp. MP36]
MPHHRPAEPDIQRYYTEVFAEAERLDRTPQGRLEATRTRDLLTRLLPPPPATVLDVGGGPGAYAGWLAAAGHRVHLVDLVPAHVAAAGTAYPEITASVGDARDLPLPDDSVDVTLLLGPLYHLTARADRVAALREAARLTRPGGPIVAAVISRNAALIDLTAQGRVDERTRALLLGEYATGVNDPETGFTTAYFHRPEEVVDEFSAAGLPAPRLYGVEGPLWPLLNALDTGPEDRLFQDAVACAAAFEQDPAILGASAHLLAVAPA